MKDVGQWLESLGLERYTESFADNDIDWSHLPDLEHEVLQAIGVKSAGHRMTLLKAAANIELNDQPAPRPGSSSKESVAAAVAGGAEHRQLTVMFCDLADSTALSGELDTEQFRDVILAYQAKATECVQRYEGYVARVFGDGLLVYFGYPQAHEDEAQRAIHAGLDVLRECRAEHGITGAEGIPLAVRIGIATGPVVVGDIVGAGASQESAVLGETPNLAARLQALAARNEMLISSATRNLAGGGFKFDDLGEHVLKGVAQPVNAWRVAGEREVDSRFDATRGDQLQPLIGRDEQRDILLTRWRRAVAGAGQVVLVSGEAGIGKSRLSRAIKEEVDGEQVLQINYQCSPYHLSSALYPIISQLERAAGFVAEDAAETKLDKLEALLGEATDDVRPATALLSALLSLPGTARYGAIELTPARQKDRTLEVLVEQMLGLAAKQPLLMVFEDAHWIDPTSLELLDLCVRRVAQTRVLLLLTHRPEFAPPWIGEAHVSTVALNKLDPINCSAIVSNVTHGCSLPDAVMAEIISKTDGVPLFVEELTKNIIESGMLRLQVDRYVLDQPLNSMQIPSTLQDSLMARLDRLGTVKDIAQIGSVIGREFDHELIAAVAAVDAPELNHGLGRLADAGLVFRRGTPPQATYVFKHALIQDTAYASLLRSKRQQLHAKIGSVLVERFPDLVDGQPELAAHHLAAADKTAQAIDYWHRAARLAKSHVAYQEAYNHLGSALDAQLKLPQTDETRRLRLDLLGERVTPIIATRSYGSPELVGLYDDAMAIYRSLDDVTTQIFPIIYARWVADFTGGARTSALVHTAEFQAEAERQAKAERPGSLSSVVMGRRMRGMSLVMSGRPAEALEELSWALQNLDETLSNEIGFTFGQDTLAAVQVYVALSNCALGRFRSMYEAVERALTRAAQVNDPLTTGYVNGHFCVLFSELRDVDNLASCMATLQETLREHPMPTWLHELEYMRGVAESLERADPQLMPRMRQSIEALERIGFMYWRPVFEANMARCYLQLGDAAMAEKAINHGIKMLENCDLWEAGELRRLQGNWLAANGAEPDSVEFAYAEAVDETRNRPNKLYELRATVSLARHLCTVERCPQAVALLQAVCDSVVEREDICDLREAIALLTELKRAPVPSG